MIVTDADVLVVVDVQNDFCVGGNLAVPSGDDVVVLTQDWHPPGHSSFASSHPGRQAFEQVEMPYGPQTLWPDHCIQGDFGAAFHERLDVTHAELVIRKGFRPAIDSYSAFFENDHATPTGLAGYLRERGFSRVYLAGLAFDYCVRYSAEDAHSLGFETFVIGSACRAIDLQGSAKATRESFREKGISLI
jgi:nicotinamidase/pyrazinamidase